MSRVNSYHYPVFCETKIPKKGGGMSVSSAGRKSILTWLAATAVTVSLAGAAVPSYYHGVPYPIGSAPKEIPGRLNFHDYDKGGPNVSFEQDDMASGHWGGCSAGLRDTGALKDNDSDHPSFNLTNHFTSPSDTFYAAGVSFPNGVRFPSPDTSFAANDWYIGAAHADDWFNITIHVSTPGKYWISSIWASTENPIKYELFFIGTQYAATKDTIRTPVVQLNNTGYGSYHAWRKYTDFVSIQLDSGTQIVNFHTLTTHLNMDFLYIAADSGKFPTGIGRPASRLPGKVQPNLSIERGIARFSFADAGKTKLAVYDCLGRQIATVLDRTIAAGSHTAALNTTGLKKGVYFARLEHGGASSVAKFYVTKRN
jgi:hypothetical protein